MCVGGGDKSGKIPTPLENTINQKKETTEEKTQITFVASCFVSKEKVRIHIYYIVKENINISEKRN